MSYLQKRRLIVIRDKHERDNFNFYIDCGLKSDPLMHCFALTGDEVTMIFGEEVLRTLVENYRSDERAEIDITARLIPGAAV